jgi:hypothetical protein
MVPSENAEMDIKAVNLYDSSSGLKRLIWNNITQKKGGMFLYRILHIMTFVKKT